MLKMCGGAAPYQYFSFLLFVKCRQTWFHKIFLDKNVNAMTINPIEGSKLPERTPTASKTQ